MRILAIADEPSPRLWGDLCRSALSGMDLYGCGTYGVNGYECRDLRLEG